MAKKKTACDSLKRMKDRPYYAVLHAINFIKGRLPEEAESFLGDDPEACLLYARKVMKGRLPDHLHNRMVMGVWDDSGKRCLKEYLEFIPEKSDA